MRTLICSSLILLLTLTLMPLSFAQDLTKKVKIVCAWKDGDNVTIVPIPDKEEVLAMCVKAGGTVVYFEEVN